MRKKNISIILPSLDGGGAERVNLDLAHEFDRKGFQVEFVLMQARGELLKEAEDKFSVFDMNCERARNISSYLRKYFRNRKPDVLIISIWPLTVIVPIVLYFSSYSCKVIICEHNTLSLQYKNYGKFHHLAMRISMAVGYRLAHSRVGVSKGVIEDISNLSWIGLRKFKVIHNPVRQISNPSEQSLRDIETLWSCESGARILSVGSFKKQKNHQLLLRAFAQLENKNAHLMLVGEGEGKNYLLKLTSELGLAEKVTFAGFQIDPTPFYKTADLFVLSSNYEGFGNVIVEALACGTRVVSTDCKSGPSEILEKGKYGILVPVSNENALSSAIKQALSSPKNPSLLIERAKNFAQDIIAERYLELL